MVGRKPGKLVGRSPSGVQISLSALFFLSFIIFLFHFVLQMLIIEIILLFFLLYNILNLNPLQHHEKNHFFRNKYILYTRF